MSAAERKPEIVVFAGPNGSGKSTITSLLRPVDVPYVNADDIQRILGCGNMEAAKMAERQREGYLEQKKSFCFETVLSTQRNLNLLKRAKEQGFFIPNRGFGCSKGRIKLKRYKAGHFHGN